MSKSRRASIVSRLLAKAGITEPAVDVFRLVREEGISLIFDEMDDDDSGLLLIENKSAAVAINRNHHPNRQRFTAAHELGHYFLHSQGSDRLFVDKAYYRGVEASSGTQREEIEANQIAAELLMPAQFVEEFASQLISDLDIVRLSMLFEVSEQAMTLRLVNLGKLHV